MFGSRPPPLHPELATWVGSVHADLVPTELAEGGHRGVEIGGRRCGEEEKEEGEAVAPLFKFRDPHLAGGKK